MASITRLLETALYVDDVERAADFYQQVLGLQPVAGATLEADSQRRVLCPLQIPGGQILLLFKRGSCITTAVHPGGTIPPHNGEGPLHLAFAISAAELDGWRQRLHDQQVAIEGEMEWPRGGTSLYFRDPDRHLVELVTPGIWSVY